MWVPWAEAMVFVGMEKFELEVQNQTKVSGHTIIQGYCITITITDWPENMVAINVWEYGQQSILSSTHGGVEHTGRN